MATILVVDDREINRRLLKTILSYNGHKIVEAADGAEALLRVREELPDLVITDILMPVVDGYEFVRQLREDKATNSVRVLFYSAAYLNTDAEALAKASGNKTVELAAVKEILNLTGYIRGGVSPIGTKKAYPVFVDSSAQGWQTIAVSAGIRGCQLVLAPEDLARVVNAQISAILSGR